MEKIIKKYKIKNALLVQPSFPLPVGKSRNHSKYFPIGLLKISTYLKEKFEIKTQLVFYNETGTEEEMIPDIIFVTSIFTYWSKYVKDTVNYFKKKYPNVPIVVGGVYASLMPEHCKKYTGCDYVIQGPIEEVDEYEADEDLIDIDFQILHTSRGCPRRCKFCGVYDIEEKWKCKYSIKKEIKKKKIVFYDNNILANEYIEFILDELIELKKQKKIKYVESQSGIDGRIIKEKPFLAIKLFKAGFKNIKIAWDGPLDEYKSIERQIIILEESGFKRNEIGIFMIYNAHLSFEEVEKKRMKCAEWGVQVVGCRYIPLNQVYDNYNPFISNQTNDDYFINEKNGWTDLKNKKFKKNIRLGNICVRYRLDFYSKTIEKGKRKTKMTKEEAREKLNDFWDPLEFHNYDEEI